MAAEEPAELIAERHAAGDAGRGRRGILEEASAAALCGGGSPRAGLRGGIGLRLRRRRSIAWPRTRPALIGGGVRTRRRRGRPAAEDRSPQIAEETRLLRLLFAALAGSRFQLGHPLSSRFESVLLNEHGLGEDIGRERHGANSVVDESFGLRLARRGAGRIDALEKTGEHLAFFGGHVALRYGPRRPRRAYGHCMRPIQDGSLAFFLPLSARPARLYSDRPIVYPQFRKSASAPFIVAVAGVLRV